MPIQELVRSPTGGKEPHKGVTRRVVAIGAAIQGGVLSSDVTDILC